MRENRLSGSMRGEARRSLACASQSVRFAYSTVTSAWLSGGIPASGEATSDNVSGTRTAGFPISRLAQENEEPLT